MLKPYRRLSRNTVVLSMSVGLVLTANFAWTPLLPLHLRNLGANELEVGVVFSFLELAHALPALLGGVLADRFGRKWVFTAPGFVLTPLYLVAALTHDWLVLAVVLTATNIV